MIKGRHPVLEKVKKKKKKDLNRPIAGGSGRISSGRNKSMQDYLGAKKA